MEAISTTAEINVTQLVNLAVEIDLTNQDSKNVANSTSSDELVSRDSILQGFLSHDFFVLIFDMRSQSLLCPFSNFIFEQCLVVET